jgi:hypothetical protein
MGREQSARLGASVKALLVVAALAALFAFVGALPWWALVLILAAGSAVCLRQEQVQGRRPGEVQLLGMGRNRGDGQR